MGLCNSCDDEYEKVMETKMVTITIVIHNRLNDSIVLENTTILPKHQGEITIIDPEKDLYFKLGDRTYLLDRERSKSSYTVRCENLLIWKEVDKKSICHFHIDYLWRRIGLINDSSKSINIKDVKDDRFRSFLTPHDSDVYTDVYILTHNLNKILFSKDVDCDGAIFSDKVIDGLVVTYVRYDDEDTRIIYRITDEIISVEG